MKGMFSMPPYIPPRVSSLGSKSIRQRHVDVNLDSHQEACSLTSLRQKTFGPSLDKKGNLNLSFPNEMNELDMVAIHENDMDDLISLRKGHHRQVIFKMLLPPINETCRILPTFYQDSDPLRTMTRMEAHALCSYKMCRDVDYVSCFEHTRAYSQVVKTCPDRLVKVLRLDAVHVQKHGSASTEMKKHWLAMYYLVHLPVLRKYLYLFL